MSARKRRWAWGTPSCARTSWWARTVRVILSDDIIDAETPCLRQLLDVYEFYAAPVLALMEVPRENISAYGVVDAEPVAHNGGKRPAVPHPQSGGETQGEDAPSNLAIIGRYVLTPEIFHSLETIEPGSGGEIQLTDGLQAHAAQPADLRLRSKASATTRATSRASCKPPWSSPSSATIWANRSATTSRL